MSQPHKRPHPLVKLGLDLGPLLFFFVIYRFLGIMTATASFMGVTALSLGLSWWIERRLHPMPVITAMVVAIFGGLTLWLDDATFIKLKPTLIYSIFAVILLGGLAFGHPLLQALMGNLWRLDIQGWRRLTLRFGIFFLIMAIANEVIWRNFSLDAWVNWKTFGILPITFIFSALQMPLIQHHTLPEETPSDSIPQ
ncbi:MAG: septation protein A [Alphaproteobacteria bacterium]